MLSRLEQAIADILAANQTPKFGNVLAAYKLHCDKKQLQHAQLYFQIAMDKYPDATEKTQSPYALLIANIRKEYLESSINAAVSVFGAYALLPCPCNCGALLNMKQFRKQLDIVFGPITGIVYLRRTALRPMCSRDKYDSDQFASPGLEPIRKMTKRRRAARKVKGRAQKIDQSPKLVFDPVGPSTSRASI